MKQQKNFRKFIFPILIILFAALLLCFFFLWKKSSREKRADLERLSAEEYNGFFLSMYAPEFISEEEFFHYTGLQIIPCSYLAESFSDLSDYLDTAFSSDNPVTNIYLELDSSALWDSSLQSIRIFHYTFQKKLAPYIASHPEASFVVLFSHPSLKYWMQASEAEKLDFQISCLDLLSQFQAYLNVTPYFPGAEEWLIANPDNYMNDIQTTPDIEKTLFLQTFQNHYLIAADNADVLFDSLQALINEALLAPKKYPDLSDYSFVFFGDSIIGNYEGSASIPGVLSALSNAEAYNCAISGTSASFVEDENMVLDFPDAVSHFIGKDVDGLPDKGPYRASLAKYLSDNQENRPLCFVIHYGLNDYFYAVEIDNEENPYDINTYCGALRTGIKALQEAYPEAVIILDAPTYVPLAPIFSENADEKSCILTDYVNAALLVSKEMNVFSFNPYEALGINETNFTDYLPDSCHLNEKGRYLFGTKFLAYLEEIL